MIRPLLMTLIAVLAFSCQSSVQSTDFTPPGSFTNGVEGPATDQQGNIYAVNFKKQGTIGKITPDGESSIFLSLPEGSIGNGIRFGDSSQMFIADYTQHIIWEVDITNMDMAIFAHDSTANQPNDLAISPNRVLYASDPNWADSTGKLWKISLANGFELLEEQMGTTNGIEVSPNGQKLYVNESIQRNIWMYDIADDGSVSNKQLFHAFEDFGLDGMRCDKDGNIYVCRYGKGVVAVLSPQGELIKELKLIGEKPTNITFSPDYSMAYITMQDRGCLERVKL
ncbi:MAG: SMP-30/gluconolactonase/LRE family protein [Bacteroidota bacterium]